MKEYYYIRNNTIESLRKLRQADFRICHCCSFKDAKWLTVYPHSESVIGCLSKSVHGVGYGCERECKDRCPDKCIMCGFNEHKANIHIFNDADSLLEYVSKIYS